MILGLDPVYWLFMLPGLIIGIVAQFKLKGTYARYLQEPSASGLSGAEAAREILDHAGLQDIPIEEIPGQLTDHYDPLRRRLCLSAENYRGRSLAAMGVAAHEAGHALQQKAAYAPLQLRMAMVPTTNFASSISMILILIGLFMSRSASTGHTLMMAGVVLFGVVTLFQIITLPVEFDASSRAKKQLLSLGLVTQQELTGVSRVLSAAAMTYVAAMVTAVLQLLYFLSLANRRN